MRNTILFIASFILITGCSESPQTPLVTDEVQEWASGCMRDPESCFGDVAYVANGDIFIVNRINGQLEPDGTWPDLSGQTSEGRKLSVFLLGLENAGKLGVIEHVVEADIAYTDNPDRYLQAAADWSIAMETKEE